MKKHRELVGEILNLNTREDALKFCDRNNMLIDNLPEEGDELINRALTHLCVLLTPEDYDDDVCD